MIGKFFKRKIKAKADIITYSFVKHTIRTIPTGSNGYINKHQLIVNNNGQLYVKKPANVFYTDSDSYIRFEKISSERGVFIQIMYKDLEKSDVPIKIEYSGFNNCYPIIVIGQIQEDEDEQ